MTDHVTIELGKRSFDVPPFMLAEMELAAPHIDRINELSPTFRQAQQEKKVPALATQFQLLRAQVEVIAIGIAMVDPAITADVIMKTVNFSSIASLGAAVNKLISSSGIQLRGEVTAPKPKGKGAKASPSK